jgi:hypothetical protein
MLNPPRIWLDYRPVRVGWMVSNQDLAQLVTAASWSACVWGGRHHCVIPVHDARLAEHLVSCFGVDVLRSVKADEATAAFSAKFPHLVRHSWRDTIFGQRSCEYADIRHAWRRVITRQDNDAEQRIRLPVWDANDALSSLLALQFGNYPEPSDDIADYKAGLEANFDTSPSAIAIDGPLPDVLFDGISPLAMTGYDLARPRDRREWFGPSIVLGSVDDFDALAMFWNLRAAGAPIIFYDQRHSPRLKPFAEAFLARFRAPGLERQARMAFWIRADRRPGDDSWKPDLDLSGFELRLHDGRGDALWNGLNIEAQYPRFSVQHRDVVPALTGDDNKARVSFALPDRPFNDEDTQASSQHFAVVVDADESDWSYSDSTFETPFVPRLNEFYGRNVHFEYDAARAQLGRLDRGAVAIITHISTQRLQINSFRVLDWMRAFFKLCDLEIEPSEAGLRCSRLIAQLGGLQDCRVLKIRGVRDLLRKYGVDESFTRSGAIEAIRDVDPNTHAVGFDAFKDLHIEYRRTNEFKPDDVLRYLLQHRVFRVGLELTCPNCQLPSWIHLDDVKTTSACVYCDHRYDVTAQLRDRDWRYRRSGIFGREDNQLGGVPVAVTLQQLATSLHEDLMMYSTAMKSRSAGASIEPCESDFVAVVSGKTGVMEKPVQIVIGEAKSEGPIDAQDVRKLGKLADAIPRDLAQTFILFSKTGTFSPEEIALAQTLNAEHRHRVILWSRDELEPYFLYERAKPKLGQDTHAVSLVDMVNVTRRLYFTPAAAGATSIVQGPDDVGGQR